MNRCDEYRVKILRYVDDDLQGNELDDFRTHLDACVDCRVSLEAEQALPRIFHARAALET
jgi:hypothetical protein